MGDSERPTRRRNLDEVYEEEIREGTFQLGLPHWFDPSGDFNVDIM